MRDKLMKPILINNIFNYKVKINWAYFNNKYLIIIVIISNVFEY